jgi:hypothetical protein
MKVKDYHNPYIKFIVIVIEVDGYKYSMTEAANRFPEHEISAEVIKQKEKKAYEDLFQKIELFETKKELKEYAFMSTDPYYKSGTRENHVKLFLQLFEEWKYCIEDWKLDVFKTWAKKFLMPGKIDTELSIPSEVDIIGNEEKIGAQYARLHYDEIRKILSKVGIINEAIRMYDPSLDEDEVNRVRQAFSRLLKENGLKYPYR